MNIHKIGAKKFVLRVRDDYYSAFSHKGNGKPRRNSRESGNHCSHRPGKLGLNVTSKHNRSDLTVMHLGLSVLMFFFWGGFSVRISKVLCCQTTRLTGTECCRLRGTQECFCSTHMHDSAGSNLKLKLIGFKPV